MQAEVTNPVDQLGLLMAQIAELEKQADAIKTRMREAATAGADAPNSFEGAMYRAAVVAANRSTTDWKAVAKVCSIPAEVIAANTKTSAVFTVRVTAR
jgi:hypothetical protein